MTMTDLPRRPEDTTSVRGQLLRLLRDVGPMPRISLARMSGLSPTSITRTIGALQDEGLVKEGDTVSPNRLGRPATEIRLTTDAVFVIGVQIGVGFVQIGILDVLGRTIASSEFVYPVDAPAEEVLLRTAEYVGSLIEATPNVTANSILGVGVAAPGAVDADHRRVIMPVNIAWRDIPVSDILESSLDLPVLVQHNVRSMALAEARFGAGRGLDSVAFVYLRTGLGAGLTLEGQPFVGGVHGAIEIGHLKTDPANLPCVCGSRGCIETVVADYALRAACARLDVDPTHGGPLYALFAARDRPAVSAHVDHVVEQLSIGLSTLGTLLNPKIVLLGGVLAEMPPEFLAMLQERAHESLFMLIRDSVRFQASSLGLNAGVTGGGALALDAWFYA